MKIHTLIAQRGCHYPGQYAPEVLAAVDENGNEINPGFLLDAYDENKESGEFSSLAIIVIEVPDDEIDKRLNPVDEIVQGQVV
jgi:hypothetical protein